MSEGVKAGSLYYSVAIDRTTLQAIKAETARIGKELAALMAKAGSDAPAVKPKVDPKPLTDLQKTTRETTAELKRLADEEKAGTLTREKYTASVEAARDKLKDLWQESERGSTEMDELSAALSRSQVSLERIAQQDTRTAMKDSQEAISGLSHEVFGLRNQLEAGAVEEDEFRKRMQEIIDTAKEMAKEHGRNTREFRQITNAAGGAARALAVLDNKQSMLGMSAQIVVGGTSLLNRNLQQLGPLGVAAGSILSMLQKWYASAGGAAGTGALGINAFNMQAVRTTGLVGVGLVGALVAGTAAIMKQAAAASEWATSLEVATFRLGLGVEATQEMHFAASQTGVSVNQLEGTMQSLQRRQGAAISGNKAYADAYKELGVELRDTEGNLRSMEDLLPEIADGFAGIANEGDRVRIATTIMNRTGVALLPLLARGSKGIAELRQEARDLGIVMSAEGVRSLDAYGARIAGVQQQFQALGREMILSFIPYLENDVIPVIQGTAIPVFKSFMDLLSGIGRAFSHDAGSGVKPFTADVIAATGATLGMNAGLQLILRTLGATHPVLRAVTLGISAVTFGYQVWKKYADAAAEAQGKLKRELDTLKDTLGTAQDRSSVIGSITSMADTLDGPMQTALHTLADNLRDSQGDFEEWRDAGIRAVQDLTRELELQPLVAKRGDLLGRLQALEIEVTLDASEAQLELENLRSQWADVEEVPIHILQHMMRLESMETYGGPTDRQREAAAAYRTEILASIADVDHAMADIDRRYREAGAAAEDAAGGTEAYRATLATLRAELQELQKLYDDLGEDDFSGRSALDAEMTAIEARIKAMERQKNESKKLVGAYGSLKHAQDELTKANEKLSIAPPELQAELKLLRDEWQETVDAITKELNDKDDPLAPVRLWVGRLLFELEEDMKTGFDLKALLEPKLAELKEQLGTLWADGLGGSDAAEIIKQQIDVIETGLSAAAGKFEQNLKDAYGALDFSVPFVAMSPAEAIMKSYQDEVLRVADAHAALNGVTHETRAAYADTLDLFEFVFAALEEGTDDWFAMADAIVNLRAEVAELDETLAPFKAERSFPDPFAQWAAPDAGIRMTLQIVEQIQGRFLNLDDAVRKVWKSGVVLTEDMLAYLIKSFDEVDGKAAGLSDALGRLNLQMDGGQLVATVGKYEAMRTALTTLGQAAGFTAEQYALVNAEIDKMEAESAADAAIKEADALLNLNEAQREYGLTVRAKEEVLRSNIGYLETQLALHEEGTAEYLKLITAINGYRQALKEANDEAHKQQYQAGGFGLTDNYQSAAAVLSTYYGELAATTKTFEELGVAEESYQSVVREGIEVLQMQLSVTKATDEGYGQLISTLLQLMSLDPLANLEKRLSTLGHESKDVFEQMKADIEALTGIDEDYRLELLADVDVKKAEADMRLVDKTLEELAKSMELAEIQAALFNEQQELAGVQADLHAAAIEALLPILGNESEIIQRLAGDWKDLTDEQKAADKQLTALADNLGIAADALKSVGGAAGGPMGDFLSGLGGMVDTARQFASGDIAGGIISTVTSIVAGFGAGSKAAEDMKHRIDDINKSFSLIDPNEFVEKTRKKVGSILWIFPVYAQVVDESLTNANLAIARAVEGGMVSGIQNARNIILSGGSLEDVRAALKDGLKQGVIDGLMEGFLQGELMKDLVGNQMTAISAAIMDARKTGDFSLVHALMAGMDSELDAAADLLVKVLEPFQETAAETTAKLAKGIADSLASGVEGGLARGVKAYMDSGKLSDLTYGVESGLFDAVTDALVQSLVQGTIMRGALGASLDDIAEAFAAGDTQRAADLTSTLMQAIPALAAQLQPVIDALRAHKPTDPNAKAASANTGGVQVGEITGPTRNMFLDLFSPLKTLDSVPGLLARTYDLLDARLPSFNAPTLGVGSAPAYQTTVNIHPGAIVIKTGATGTAVKTSLSDGLEDTIRKGLKGIGR